jgi:hypothetical protein
VAAAANAAYWKVANAAEIVNAAADQAAQAADAGWHKDAAAAERLAAQAIAEVDTAAKDVPDEMKALGQEVCGAHPYAYPYPTSNLTPHPM